MATLLELVSPDGVLHLVPDETKAKAAFCKAHGLRPAYVNLHVAGDASYKRETSGWAKLDLVKWLRHAPTGAIAAVVGKPKRFFDTRGSACERAGIQLADAMPFELRQFERLLAGELAELEGWVVLVAEPPALQTHACDSKCPTCSLLTSDLYHLLIARGGAHYVAWAPSSTQRQRLLPRKHTPTATSITRRQHQRMPDLQ